MPVPRTLVLSIYITRDQILIGMFADNTCTRHTDIYIVINYNKGTTLCHAIYSIVEVALTSGDCGFFYYFLSVCSRGYNTKNYVRRCKIIISLTLIKNLKHVGTYTILSTDICAR